VRRRGGQNRVGGVFFESKQCPDEKKKKPSSPGLGERKGKLAKGSADEIKSNERSETTCHHRDRYLKTLREGGKFYSGRGRRAFLKTPGRFRV